jgi:deferrochelatase/peroxidase EfeB
VVETWKAISKGKEEKDETLFISRVYPGFQREDKRGWLGFHDGVSNIPSNDRQMVISIGDKRVFPEERWTVMGTYLGFLRIELDLQRWVPLDQSIQEIIVGRDKLSGCPLIGVNNMRQPIKDSRCPIPGTFEIVERGNELFREHPNYGSKNYYVGAKDQTLLKNSHIEKASPSSSDRSHSSLYRIFRQGFEFLEPVDFNPGFRAGLNFISFQNDPTNLFRIIGVGFGKNKAKVESFGLPSLEDFFHVRAGGVFFIAPIDKNEPFPGASIFFDRSYLSKKEKTNSISYSYI